MRCYRHHCARVQCRSPDAVFPKQGEDLRVAQRVVPAAEPFEALRSSQLPLRCIGAASRSPLSAGYLNLPVAHALIKCRSRPRPTSGESGSLHLVLRSLTGLRGMTGATRSTLDTAMGCDCGVTLRHDKTDCLSRDNRTSIFCPMAYRYLRQCHGASA
jgi:hypothetical protein